MLDTVVHSQNLQTDINNIQINTSDWKEGIYWHSVSSSSNNIESRETCYRKNNYSPKNKL